MPMASPDTIVSPRSLRARAKARPLSMPWGVALRLPTMATLWAESHSTRPNVNSSSGGSAVSNSSAG